MLSETRPSLSDFLIVYCTEVFDAKVLSIFFIYLFLFLLEITPKVELFSCCLYEVQAKNEKRVSSSQEPWEWKSIFNHLKTESMNNVHSLPSIQSRKHIFGKSQK